MAPLRNWVLFFAVLVGSCVGRDFDLESHPLYQYVWPADPEYQYYLDYSERQDELGLTSYFINVTSGIWFDEEWSNWPVWWHWLTIHVPDELDYPDAAFMYISLGNNGGPPSVGTNHVRRTALLASENKMVTACLRNIPNQPIEFPGDFLGGRVEDEIISYTWKYFLNNSKDAEPERLLRFPMVRGVVRALDTIETFVGDLGGEANIERFMIAGESKRGWATWLAGAVDDRVVAMAPVVLSLANLQPNLLHHYRALGGWTFAFFDYWIDGVSRWLNDPALLDMAEMIDPIVFKSVMTMPKFVVKGASDEFFYIDDSRYFFSELEGPSYVWIMEDTGHEVGSSRLTDDYWEMLGTFYLTVLQNYEIPEHSWEIASDNATGSITVFSAVTPQNITAWWAPSISLNRRDFRLHQLFPPGNTGITWTVDDVEDLGDGYYRVEYPVPEEGWLAFFIKLEYEGPDGRTMYFSSEANVIPDTLPFDDCEDNCWGILV